MSRSDPSSAGDTSKQADISAQEMVTQAHRANAVQDRDAERESIARELHDRFGQYLTVMELELSAAGRIGNPPPEFRERLERMRTLTAEAQKDMADMAWQMRPASLHGQDLETACTQLVDEWGSRSALVFDLHLSLSTRLPALVEITLYRVLQEAVTNVVKHANASRIGVILRVVSHEVLLIVEDDGCGFVWDDTPGRDGPARSLGLLGIRERLNLVAGELEIESSANRGTTLIARVPL